jgi:hypothetical protein
MYDPRGHRLSDRLQKSPGEKQRRKELASKRSRLVLEIIPTQERIQERSPRLIDSCLGGRGGPGYRVRRKGANSAAKTDERHGKRIYW